MAAKERNGIGMIVSAVRDMEGGGISAAATRAATVLHSKTASELVKDCLPKLCAVVTQDTGTCHRIVVYRTRPYPR